MYNLFELEETRPILDDRGWSHRTNTQSRWRVFAYYIAGILTRTKIRVTNKPIDAQGRLLENYEGWALWTYRRPEQSRDLGKFWRIVRAIAH